MSDPRDNPVPTGLETLPGSEQPPGRTQTVPTNPTFPPPPAAPQPTAPAPPAAPTQPTSTPRGPRAPVKPRGQNAVAVHALFGEILRDVRAKAQAKAPDGAAAGLGLPGLGGLDLALAEPIVMSLLNLIAQQAIGLGEGFAEGHVADIKRFVTDETLALLAKAAAHVQELASSPGS